MSMPTNERKPETISFRVSANVFDFLQGLTKRERRKQSEIATALLERGIAAYHRDEHLFEPRPVEYKRTPVQDEAPPRKRGGGDKKTGTDNR